MQFIPWTSRESARVLPLLAGVLALASCGDADRRNVTPTSVVSATQPHEIVVTPVSAFASAEVPSGQAGAVLADGGIFVGDMQQQVVRIYSRSGVLVQTVGRASGVPIEFLRAVARCPDGTAAAIDGQTGTVYYLAGNGSVARRSQIVRSAAMSQFAGCVEHGALVALQKPARVVSTGLVRTPVAIVRTVPGQARLDTIGRFAGDDEFFSPTAPIYTPIAFGRATLAAVGGGWLFAGRTETSDVEVYRHTGEHVSTVHTPFSRRPVSEDEITADQVRWATRLKGLPGDAFNARVAEVRRLAPKLDLTRSYDQLAADDVGRLWVKPYPDPGATQVSWAVYSSAGTLVARVPLPADFEITDVRSPNIVGILTAPTGRQSVMVYDMTER
jgi:hypothetical protein